MNDSILPAGTAGGGQARPHPWQASCPSPPQAAAGSARGSGPDPPVSRTTVRTTSLVGLGTRARPGAGGL
eukprot:3284402-Pyramimonas_sp.AAC.2